MVDLVTVHHEGAGSPSDSARGADGGYSYWIGATTEQRLRSVATSFATLHYNHVSLDICLSGNRVDHPVTDNDIALVHAAFMDAHGRGEVSDNPIVHPHRFNNGRFYYRGNLFSTVCPGDLAMARFADLTAACSAKPVAPAVDPRVIESLEQIAQWKQSVTKLPMVKGERSPRVALLIDLLVGEKMLPAGTIGDYYWNELVEAVNHFKRREKSSNPDGTVFGGNAAAAILKP